MQILFEPDPAPERLADALARLDGDPAVRSLLLFASASGLPEPARLDPLLRATKKPLFGGIFPGVLHRGRMHQSGCVLLGLPFQVECRVVERLSADRADLAPRVASALAALPPPSGTLFLFVDGLATGIQTLIDTVYDHFGLELNYLGGGCGRADFRPAPCILTGDGVRADAALLAMAPDARSHIGVAHGWQPVSTPIKVTESSGGLLCSLDWRPALEVYREAVGRHAGADLETEGFAAVARSYPFGINKLDSEMVVRDPFALDGDHIQCFGEVPAGSYVHILHGRTQQLLDAAGEALEKAGDTLGDRSPALQLVFDCISRALFLEDDFDQELTRLARADAPVAGALSIGEIANYGEDYLEFYNKTAVVGLVE